PDRSLCRTLRDRYRAERHPLGCDQGRPCPPAAVTRCEMEPRTVARGMGVPPMIPESWAGRPCHGGFCKGPKTTGLLNPCGFRVSAQSLLDWRRGREDLLRGQEAFCPFWQLTSPVKKLDGAGPLAKIIAAWTS